ncbi:hypothetical protein HETIRDRAFT_119939 [Heterobasidion irregulare TC 32-1]|uniref:Uncharacterized protein n=1 Tax=Heterobasidion irregulare (strain TC 32-1) TaxID=747525 RepID=W4JWL0_HETIT|nr:uncharacterized protein HETIRDRAFT_119939 [Heterobasidion irregulare TC 32-1]ETW77937.1 hypothetical protein HETIRDRAFT_119939 [Heterobasidion irregulare TC 32-1]
MGHWGDIPSLAHESDNPLLKLLFQGNGPEARKDSSLLVCTAYTCRSFVRNPGLPDSRVKKSSYSHNAVRKRNFRAWTGKKHKNAPALISREVSRSFVRECTMHIRKRQRAKDEAFASIADHKSSNE